MSEKAGPKLAGIVMAGGKSTRMGTDKGRLEYRGVPAVVRAFGLLQEVVGTVFVSARRNQLEAAPYEALPGIADRYGEVGPLGGILSAWDDYPQAAWLVLAVDMLFVDRGLLEALVLARNCDSYATAFRQIDGRPEPLCTIYEPRSQAILRQRLQGGSASLRDFLMSVPTENLVPDQQKTLVSVDTPQAHRDAGDGSMTLSDTAK